MSVWLVKTAEPDAEVKGIYISADAVAMAHEGAWVWRGKFGTNDAGLYASEHELEGPWPTLEEEPLMALHRYLFPERYDSSIDVYQWHAGTIEDVAAMVERALKGHPRAKLWAT